MARETTDKYVVTVTFKSPTTKAQHLLRASFMIGSPKLNMVHVKSEDLEDVFTLTRHYANDAEKWEDYFNKGSHTKSYKIKLLESDHITDKFEVEVIYAGREKDFYCVFNANIHKRTGEVTTERLSTKTKNLGTKHKRKAGNDIKILQAFVEEALEKSKMKKMNTVPNSKDFGRYKTTVRSPSGYFFGDDTLSIVCVHTSKFKIGIIPEKGNMDRVKILVHYPDLNSRNRFHPVLGIKSEDNFQSLKIMSDYNRLKQIDEYNERGTYWLQSKSIGREIYTKDHENVTTFSLSDPAFFDQLVDFFNEIHGRVFVAP